MELRPSNGHEPSDVELVAAYRRGDQRAASMLFDRYYQRLAQMAQRQLGRTLQGLEEATDLAQVTLWDFFELARRKPIVLSPQGSVWPVLARILFRRASNLYRYHRREKRDFRRRVPLVDGWRLASSSPPVEPILIGELVGGLLDALPTVRQRHIVILLLEGFRVRDVAVTLNISCRTVLRARDAAVHYLTLGIDDDS